MADIDREVVELKQAIQNLVQVINVMQREHQETRQLLEQLGKVLGFEYSQDAKAWASVQKLAAFKANPRDQ